MNHRINKIKNRKKRTNQQNKVKANLLTRNHLKMRRVARKNRSQPKNKPNSKVVARTKWIKKTQPILNHRNKNKMQRKISLIASKMYSTTSSNLKEKSNSQLSRNSTRKEPKDAKWSANKNPPKQQSNQSQRYRLKRKLFNRVRTEASLKANLIPIEKAKIWRCQTRNRSSIKRKYPRH